MGDSDRRVKRRIIFRIWMMGCVVFWPMTLSGGAIAGNVVCGWAAQHLPLPSLLLLMAGGTGLTAVAAGLLAVAMRRP